MDATQTLSLRENEENENDLRSTFANSINRKLQLTACTAALLAGLSAPAFAQDQTADAQTGTNAEADDFSGVPVITVTARRVEESLQETPVAVSAFNAEALAARGIVDTSEVGNFAPNVTLDTTSTFSGASSTLQAFIRGIGQSDFAINTDPGVGIYIDDVYIARTVGAVSELYDVQQVEVLKGPQGTLFGRNSIGGAINVRTRKPDDIFSVRGSLSYGRFNYIGIDAVANLPLADGLYSSVAVSTNAQDGFQQRLVFDGPGAENLIPLGVSNVADTNGLDGGGLDNQTIRGKLLWEATDRFETTFSVDYSRIRDAAPPGTLVATIGGEEAQFVGTDAGGELANGSLPSLFNACLIQSALPAGALPPVCGLTGFASVNSDADPNNDIPPFGSQFITGDIDTTFATGANFSNIDAWGISNVSTFELPTAEIKTIIAYRELSANFGRDIDGSPLDIDQTSFVIEQNQFSAELQLNGELLNDRLSYTLGGFYFREDAFQLDQVPLGGGLLNIFGPNSQDTEAFALFGEANFEIAPDLNLLFGVRWTDETKELVLDQQNTTPFFGVVFAGLVDADGDSVFPRTNPDGTPNVNFLGPEGVQTAEFSDVSFRAGLNYKITPDIFTYFTFSQGFKSGGFTTRLTAPFNPDFDGVPGGLAALNGIVFEPETSDNYEIGLKADLFDRKLRTNLALFWNEYQDIQIVVQRGITPSNENAGDARIRGAELEVEFYPSEGLSFVGSAGYLDAEYTSIDPLAFPVEIGDQLQNTPEFTFSGAATYETPILSGRADLLLNLNYSWRDTIANDSQNTPELVQGPVGLLGGQIKLSPAEDNWAISLIGRNILNKRFIGSGFNSGPGVSFVEATFNRPGEWRLQFDFQF